MRQLTCHTHPTGIHRRVAAGTTTVVLTVLKLNTVQVLVLVLMMVMVELFFFLLSSHLTLNERSDPSIIPWAQRGITK